MAETGCALKPQEFSQQTPPSRFPRPLGCSLCERGMRRTKRARVNLEQSQAFKHSSIGAAREQVSCEQRIFLRTVTIDLVGRRHRHSPYHILSHMTLPKCRCCRCGSRGWRASASSRVSNRPMRSSSPQQRPRCRKAALRYVRRPLEHSDRLRQQAVASPA